MYSVAVVTHETLEWSGLGVTGAEVTPTWAGGDRNTQAPLIRNFSHGAMSL